MHKPILTSLAVAAFALTASAETKTFKVGSQPQRYSATFDSVTEYENFTGMTNKVTGTILFDPHTKRGGGKISVDVASLKTGVDARDEHLRGAMWLDAAKHPTMDFEATRVRALGGDKYSVTGNLTIHGVTRQVTTTATLKYRAAGTETAAKGLKGDIVQLTTSFKVKLSDYKVTIPAIAAGKVNPTVTVAVRVVGETGA